VSFCFVLWSGHVGASCAYLLQFNQSISTTELSLSLNAKRSLLVLLFHHFSSRLFPFIFVSAAWILFTVALASVVGHRCSAFTFPPFLLSFHHISFFSTHSHFPFGPSVLCCSFFCRRSDYASSLYVEPDSMTWIFLFFNYDFYSFFIFFFFFTAFTDVACPPFLYLDSFFFFFVLFSRCLVALLLLCSCSAVLSRVLYVCLFFLFFLFFYEAFVFVFPFL